MRDCNVIFRRGVPGHVPDAWILSPVRGGGAPPVAVVHGINREVEEMAMLLTARASAMGRTVVLPHFSTQHWPRYQRAACKHRADLAFLRLMAALEAEQHIAPGRFDLSGFSGGAQFAHRFTWLYPHKVARLCATAPGWWTFPDHKAAWPYGMGTPAGGDAGHRFRLTVNLRAFLDRRIGALWMR